MANNVEDFYNAYLYLMTDGKVNPEELKKSDVQGTLSYNKSFNIGIGSESNNEIYQYIGERLENLNLGYRRASGNTVLHNDVNREFVFLDESGKRVELSAQEVA
jgi:hypothetical protein